MCQNCDCKAGTTGGEWPLVFEKNHIHTSAVQAVSTSIGLANCAGPVNASDLYLYPRLVGLQSHSGPVDEDKSSLSDVSSLVMIVSIRTRDCSSTPLEEIWHELLVKPPFEVHCKGTESHVCDRGNVEICEELAGVCTYRGSLCQKSPGRGLADVVCKDLGNSECGNLGVESDLENMRNPACICDISTDTNQFTQWRFAFQYFLFVPDNDRVVYFKHSM